MRHYKQLDSSGKLVAIGTGPGNTEITESEYNALLREIREKVDYADKLYSGEITIDDVPEAWRADVQLEVNARVSAEEEASQQEISGEELMSMIEGVL